MVGTHLLSGIHSSEPPLCSGGGGLGAAWSCMEEVNRLWQHITEPFSWAVWQHCVFTGWRRTHRQRQTHTFRVALQIQWQKAATSAAVRGTENTPFLLELIAPNLSLKDFFVGGGGGVTDRNALIQTKTIPIANSRAVNFVLQAFKKNQNKYCP